jgi:hypothetical protein
MTSRLSAKNPWAAAARAAGVKVERPASTPKLARALRRAYALHKAGRLDAALPLYEQVLEAEPSNPIALHYAALLGRQLNDIARLNGVPTRDEEVMRLMAACVAAAPTNAGAVHNFAKFKHDRGELEEARHLYEHAAALRPEQAESWTNLGNVYGELGNRMRAEASWARALEAVDAVPECELPADTRFNVSFLKLLKGRYEEGWRDYECRWDTPEFAHAHGRPDLTTPRWDGRDVRGRIYLHQEQGIGDALMMARYIPWVAMHGQPVIEVVRGLVPLFMAMFPGLDVVAKGELPPKHAAHLPMLSLPFVFGTRVGSIPDPAGYWPNRADGGRIDPERGLIGLCWRGSPTHVNDRVRSMPFEAVFPMLDVPGLRWQSLQFGYETLEPLEGLPPGDFLETARQIARCELVITADTSVAHLAGTMGVPTWLLVPFVAEWRWLQDRDDSPWYPSMRIWRQEHAGDWRGLARRVATELARRGQTA